MEKTKHKFYWLNPKIEPRDTEKCGDGYFAKEVVKKDERILVIGGYIMTIEEEAALPGKNHDNGVQITEDLVICTTPDDDWAGINLLNHNCEPNAGFKGQIFLVAMRDIQKDEEITVDYAMVIRRSAGGILYELKCLCGSEKCRQIITDEDWKKPELQQKYNGYFQQYLQEKIIKNHDS